MKTPLIVLGIVVLIAVGYAADDGGVPRSVKKDLSLLREYRPPRP